MTKRKLQIEWTCGCGKRMSQCELCPSCVLYNAAVAAQKAAADSVAREQNPNAKDAWLNEHGIFAFVDGVATQVADARAAAPFVALTAAARAAGETP